MEKNEKAKVPTAPKASKTRFSGTLISLVSEGQVDSSRQVILSSRLENTLFDWANEPVPGLTQTNRVATVKRLANELVREYGIPRERAVHFAELRVSILRVDGGQ